MEETTQKSEVRMSLLARQDKAAADLVNAVNMLTGYRLDEKAKAILMRVTAGHERRTVALLTQAHADLLQCLYPPKFDKPLIPDLPDMTPERAAAIVDGPVAFPPAPGPMLVPSGTVLPFIPPPPPPPAVTEQIAFLDRIWRLVSRRLWSPNKA